MSSRDAVEKVRQVLVERLGFNKKAMFLDTDPVFSMEPNPSATNGLRRYVFQWQRPETAQQREERVAKRVLPYIAVSAEVDAVSGDIKTMNFFDRSLERPDPQLGN